MDHELQNHSLRKGWTTGACATAAAKAAFAALITGSFPDPIDVLLPRGQRPYFALAKTQLDGNSAFAAVVKDAGDDPDVTHQALICATVRLLPTSSGIVFCAGKGVGIVTKPGLALAIGEPAINPIPREMIKTALSEISPTPDAEVEISVPGGEELALKTLNPRLGILGGISILGTTGIVIPFSCSAWIHSIYRGIDVARAEGLTHIAGSTGSTSEAAIQKHYNLPESALIDMGDFVGGMLKYVRKHPVQRVTIAGGFAKMTKLAQGLLDLHSRAGSVDLDFIATLAGNDDIRKANTAKHALEMVGQHAPDLANRIAELAWQTAAQTLSGTNIELDTLIFNREGQLLAESGIRKVS